MRCHQLEIAALEFLISGAERLIRHRSQLMRSAGVALGPQSFPPY